MKQPVQVTILGQQYTVRSDAPAGQVRQVAEFVNGKIAEVAASSRVVDTLDSVVLAMLNLAGAHLALLEQGASLDGDLDRRLERLVARIERVLPDGSQ